MSRLWKLSELQIAVLRVLWERGESTVHEVHAALQPERRLATTTVATVLSRMEKQGVLAHRAQGRQFVYWPKVSEQEVRRSMVADVTERLFSGDVTALVSHLLTARDISAEELARVKALIEAKESEATEQRGEKDDEQ